MPSARYRCFAAALSVLSAALVVVSCTTFRPVVGTQEETQRRLLAGEVLAAGDRVRLTTADGQVHEIRVASVALDSGMILGEGDAVPIRNVVSLEQRVRAPGKTWGLVGGLALLLLGSQTVRAQEVFADPEGEGAAPIDGAMVGGAPAGEGDAPINGPDVYGGDVGDAPIGGPMIGGGDVGNAPIDGAMVGGAPAGEGDAPIGGETLY